MSAAPTLGPAGWIRLLGVAMQFLTRVPVRIRFEPGDLRRAAGAFPLVGVFVAGTGIGVRWALQVPLGTSLATVAAVAATVLVTGAFHEDGFADTADGLWGGRTPDERLRIMRDSRLGTYGTVALVLLFATKLAALVPMDLAGFARTLVPAMVLARASSLVIMRAIEPAPDSLAGLAGPPSSAGWAVAGVTSAASLAGFGVRAWLPL
ncbi:MAG TPA: adenosylcobinamide-GDP ribazoletransferase, partial [Actinomycetota bacterium]